MKRSVFLLGFLGLVLFLGLPFMAWANSTTVPANEQAMNAANQLYQARHYGEAIQLYEALVAQGVRDSRLLYNLGNAYYQQGDLGRARASYESAARLAPRDPDIRYNLALVSGQALGAPARTPAGLLESVADVSRRWLSINELAMVALGAWLLFGVLALVYRSFPVGQRPVALRYAAVTVLVLVALAGLPLVARLNGPASLPASLPDAGQVALNTLSLGL